MQKFVGLALSLLSTTAGGFFLLPTTPTQASPKVYLSQAQVDWGLVQTGLRQFWQTTTCQTQSQLKLQGTSQGLSFTGLASLNSIAQLPNKFRVEVQFAPSDTGQAQTVILVSDGDNFWAYRPDQQKYSQTTVTAFQNSDDNFWLGFSTIMFLSLPPDAQALFSTDAAESDLFLQDLTKQLQGLGISQGRERIEGQDTTRFSLRNQQDGLTVSIYLVPGQGQLKAIDFSGDANDMKIQMQEIIGQRTCLNGISPDTFQFTPPAGVQKVDQVKISPF